MIFEIIVLFLAIILLLAFSAFFSGSETALTASTRSRLTGLGMKGKKNSNVAIDLLNKKESLIGAILLGNNLVNILASSLVCVPLHEDLTLPDLDWIVKILGSMKGRYR